MLDLADRSYLGNARRLLRQRMDATEFLARHVLATGRLTVQVRVPGEHESTELFARWAADVWAKGHQAATSEVHQQQQRRARRHRFDDSTLGVPSDAIAWLQSRIALQGKWNRDLDAAVTQVLSNALASGATLQDIMRALAVVFPKFGLDRLENIARTESTGAYAQGRLAAYRQMQLISAVQWVSIIDSRTTDICRERDGKIQLLSNPKLQAPPAHFMCRSTLVGIDSFQLEDLRNGDPQALKDTFGYRRNGPKTLQEALDWSAVPSAQDGFGGAMPESEVSKPGRPQRETPSEAPGGGGAEPPVPSEPAEGAPEPEPEQPPDDVTVRLRGGARIEDIAVQDEIADLKRIPSDLREMFTDQGNTVSYTTGSVTDHPLMRDLKWQTSVGKVPYDDLAGVWRPDKHIIVVNLSLSVDDESTTIHEFFHAVADITGALNDNSVFEGFRSHYGQVLFQDAYTYGDVHEFWAQSWVMYFRDPELLQSLAPELYNWMRDWLGEEQK